MRLHDFPRAALGHFPTPICRLEAISSLINTQVYIKRDDLSGLGLGGNKTRALEFLLGDAQAKGAQLVFTTGTPQSNHAMLTAAAAGKCGMQTVLLLKKRGSTDCVGNQVLNRMMNTEIRWIDTDDYEEIYAQMDRLGEALGKPYYKIPCGGSNALGTLGYVDCAREISQQGFRPSHIICAEGSGGTAAGLTLGAQMFLPGAQVHAMSICSEPFAQIVPALMRGAAALLGEDGPENPKPPSQRQMQGEGFGVLSPEGRAAAEQMARLEGLFLDPCFTAKAFAGLLQMAEEGAFTPDDRVLFYHSGGAGGIFA